jgi:adenylate cyclase
MDGIVHARISRRDRPWRHGTAINRQPGNTDTAHGCVMDYANDTLQKTHRLLCAVRENLAYRFRYLDRRFQEFWAAVVGGCTVWLPGIARRARESLVRLRLKARSISLVFKVSLLITVLVVICMGLLGLVIIHQQTRMFEDQLNEQGTTLARLMAQSAREPLLADDRLALDAISNGFSRSASVVGTAITSLDGETVSHGGDYHDGSRKIQHWILSQLIANAPGSMTWSLPLMDATHSKFISFVQPVTFQNVTVGYAMVTFSQTGMVQSMRQSVHAIVGATILIILLGIAMAFALGKRIYEPIDQLVDATRAIGNGELDFRFKEQRNDELGQLMSAFNDMAEGMLEKSQVMDALARYVSPGVAKEILANLNEVELSGKRIDGSVIFADIVGFTQIAEEIRPEEIVSMLNNYFSLITRACEFNHGMVDKYLGDGIMLVFGAPQPDENHRFHAISCALLMQRLVDHENQRREKQGMFPVKFKIGINSGIMLAGNMGSRERMEYTVVGDTVNLASRLCGISNSGQIVISRDMYLHPKIEERVIAGEFQSIRLRGIRDPVSTYLVEGLGADWQSLIDEQFNQIIQVEDHECVTQQAV